MLLSLTKYCKRDFGKNIFQHALNTVPRLDIISKGVNYLEIIVIHYNYYTFF